jgi:formylglycine-generating enzyme
LYYDGIPDGARAEVFGGYSIAATETTYELWYQVREWAISKGYTIATGQPGSSGLDCDYSPDTPPEMTEENKNHPVTCINWRDIIVWTNALSEMAELDPVYRASEESTTWYKDSSADIDAAVETGNDGYRLPTSYEWEMAARWIGTTEPGFTAVETTVDGTTYYWTPGNHASGSTLPAENVLAVEGAAIILANRKTATNLVAHHSAEFNGQHKSTLSVGSLEANQRGLYDMSGNVQEICYDNPEGFAEVDVRGGSFVTFWNQSATALWVSYFGDAYYEYSSGNTGFRLARD